jgi:IclR family KDG regulon transcriptional repressor
VVVFRSGEKQKPGNLVQTIERISSILDVLGKFPRGISVGELSEKVGLPRGSTHRLLSSLAYFDFVSQNKSTKEYHLGFKLVELGSLLINQIDFRNEARSFMQELAKKTGETIHLVVLDHNDALYIDKVTLNQNGLQMMSRVGLRMPIHCTAVGKILAAYLAEDELDRIINENDLSRLTKNTITNVSLFKEHLKNVRACGYAIDDEENEKGIRCVAAPIRSANGEVLAALSISGPSIRLSVKAIQNSLKDQVCTTALNISKKIGFRG